MIRVAIAFISVTVGILIGFAVTYWALGCSADTNIDITPVTCQPAWGGNVRP